MKNILKAVCSTSHPKSALGVVLLLTFSAHSSANLTLQDAIQLAIKNDPWLTRSELNQRATQWQSVAADTLPNPVLSVGMLNLPSNGFDPNQEDMTQLKVGISQALPRGNSLTLKREMLETQAQAQPYLRANRKAQVRLAVTQHWLVAYQAHLSQSLMQHHRHLFVELLALSEARYQSTQGPTRLQDMVQAKVEIARIDDKLDALNSEFEAAWLRLSEWLTDHPEYQNQNAAFITDVSTIPTLNSPTLTALKKRDFTQLSELTKHHPTLRAVNQNIRSSALSIKLAEQAYKPQWGINTSYAYRDDRENGDSRADFFSVGVTLDMPLFNTARQDADVSSAKLKTEATRTEQRLLHQQLIAKALSVYSRMQQLQTRETRYENDILPQLQHRSDAAIASYRHANGIFDVAVQAHIAHLQAQVELIKLRAQRLQAQSELAYYFSSSSHIDSHQGGQP